MHLVFKNALRMAKHWVYPQWRLRQHFPLLGLQQITAAVAASETRHRAELRVAIEAALPFSALRRNCSARARALQVFSDLRVWDTEENNGVLLYVLLADRRIEIVSDRAIHQLAGDTAWQAVIKDIQLAFSQGLYTEGVIQGTQGLGDILAAHYPAHADNPNELPDAPVIL